MANDDRAESTDLKILESRIDELIETCRRLKIENSSLKSDQNNLNEQHERLMEKTRLARAGTGGRPPYREKCSCGPAGKRSPPRGPRRPPISTKKCARSRRAARSSAR